MAGTIAVDVCFGVTQTGESLGNLPKSSFQGMKSRLFRTLPDLCSAPRGECVERPRRQRPDHFEFSWRAAEVLPFGFVLHERG
jgi:hypothetical protein